VKLGYTWVKRALQTAGLVKRARASVADIASGGSAGLYPE